MSDLHTKALLDLIASREECDRLRAELAAIKASAKRVNADGMAAIESLIELIEQQKAELAEQKRINVQLAERLAACSQVLGRAAERGKVCVCKLDTTQTA